MMENKTFFDEATEAILHMCKEEKDYISVYKRITEYQKSHDIKETDTEWFSESGAAEVLAMATQRYRRKNGLESI